MATPPIRLAFIGLGWAVRELWAPRIGDHPAFTVVAVYDPDPLAVQWAAEMFPSARPLLDPSDLGTDQVDLAVVATPNHLHAPTAIALLIRGITTFIEKPVCLSSVEAAALAAAEQVGGASVLAGTAAWYRHDVEALRELLPELGPLRAVELSWVRASGIPAPGGWFTERRRAGGGALVDLGWHLITVGMRMVAWPEVTQVIGGVSADFLARTGTAAVWRGNSPGGTGTVSELAPKDVEDTARGVLVLDGGPLVNITVGWASHIEHDVTRLVLEGADARAELTCTFGLSPNRVPSTLVVRREGMAELVPLIQQDRGSEYRRQLDLLPALLTAGRQRGATTAEVIRTVDIIERIYLSAGAAPLDRPATSELPQCAPADRPLSGP